jgi:hypothetical protein
MRYPYKDIGFDSHRIGFGRRAGIVVVDLQKGFTEARFPLDGRSCPRQTNPPAPTLKPAKGPSLSNSVSTKVCSILTCS